MAQIMALGRRQIAWAARVSDVFQNRGNHDTIFDRSVLKYPRDMIMAWNLFKAVKRGLALYLDKPTHADGTSATIFRKPVVRMYVYFIALMYLYQTKALASLRQQFAGVLCNKASPLLVDEMEKLCWKIVRKTRDWYMETSQGLEVEVSKKKMDQFVDSLGIDLKLDLAEGVCPFCERSWPADESG
jgi:hypothetical protein